jgi:hypothetical protein
MAESVHKERFLQSKKDKHFRFRTFGFRILSLGFWIAGWCEFWALDRTCPEMVDFASGKA